MDKKLYTKLAKELLKASDEVRVIPQFTDTYPDITKEDAYAVQKELIRLRTERGEHIIGKKIGLTSQAMMNLMGVFEPDYGVITNYGLIEDGSTLDMSKLIVPHFETEIIFMLNKALDKDVITYADVIEATEGVLPGLEIVDSRFGKIRVKIQDTIADTASYGRILVGGTKLIPLNDLDISLVPMVAFRNGKFTASGCSAAVMDGNPIRSVLWLARKMKEQGTPLQAGELVLSGSFIAMQPIEPGDRIEVDFGPLGHVHLNASER